MDPRTSAQDVMRCDLCETAVVQMHCDTCLVNICKACVGEHISTDESKDHKIVKFQSRKSTPLYPGCATHDKERCEMYCKQCDIPLQTLRKHLDEITKTMSDIRDEIKAVNATIDTNDLSKLFGTKFNKERYQMLPQKIVPSLPKFLPGKIHEKELHDRFGALELSSLTSDKHGYSMKTAQKSPKAGSSSPVKQLLDKPEAVTTIHTGYKDLYRVACLSDEDIWTSGDENIMKLFSINLGSLLKSIRTKSGNEPSDIAVTKSGDLVYIDTNDRTVNIVKNMKIKEVIRLQNWRPRGVCSTSSDDLVIMVSDDKRTKVVHYSGSTEKQTIQFDDNGKPLYSSGSYITENRILDICVSDREAGEVVVVNQAGKLRFRYNGHTPAPKNKPFSPLGITTDSQSHILTADDNNNCVHIIDQNGQFLRYIECGLSGPMGLCLDTNDNLFVAQWIRRQVKKIKYMQ
ncbi:uncharacterized protein LOC134250046 [Saccostrea cucullata]|uniref:uncharacterized protein LOC134250046 n=1 Tax=Saccostrea cuccullata TaxID=36930 RepID=UPI002ED49193